MMIKTCSEEDIQAVGRFYDSVVRYLDENINYPKWVYKKYPSENSVREMTKAGCQFMCLENDEIIGAFVLNEEPQGMYENADWSRQLPRGAYMVCHTLAVDSLLQGKGIGGQIVNYCIDYARKHAFEAIRLDVVPDNIPARKLYEKCGFRYAGDADLERDIAGLPLFSMYELNF